MAAGWLAALVLVLPACVPAKPLGVGGPAFVASDPPGAPAASALSAAPTLSESEFQMTLTKALIGKTADAHEVELYTLTNSHGMTVNISTYGAIVTSVEVPDKNGNLAN